MATFTIVQSIDQLLKPLLGDRQHWTVAVSPNPELGDFAVALFAVAKQQGVSPAELAQQVASQLTAKLAAGSPIERIVAAGPYVNFFIKPAAAVAAALALQAAPSPTGRKILVEFFNPNPLKVFHIGHLLNAALGESIRRLLAAQGHTVIGCSYSGDVGTHVAKWLWYYQHQYQGQKIADVPVAEFAEWAGSVYVNACAAVATDPSLDEAVAEYNRLIDQQDPQVMPDWQAAVDKSYQALAVAAAELGCQIDYTFRESATAGPGKAYVQTQIDAGTVVQDQGAWVINLEEYKLGVFILLKSDGTALYQTKDFGLVELKRQRIGAVDESIVVVGGEQQYYFKQLHKAMELLNYPGW
ncbi:MAG: arginine--tRNA ligase, partial [Patescibacteria group bacterium]